MIEINKFKIGLFVISGIIVILGAIFLFGGSNIFKEEIKLVTVYDESVQGLERGSQVKFRGVPVGKVTEIAILQNNSKIRIKMQIDPAAFVPVNSNDAETIVSSAKEQGNELKMFIQQQIKKGLQIRMEYAGITGFKYIEMNYFNAPENKLLPPPEGLEYDEIYIAAAPSILSDAIQNISTSLENISKIRFDKISSSLENTAEKINEFIDNDSIQDTVKNLKNITGKIDRGMNEKQIAEVSAALRQAIQNFSMITEKLQKEDNINKTATAIKGAGDAVIQSSESLESTLFKLNATLDKLTLLLNLLNENPSALLRGKEAKTSEIR